MMCRCPARSKDAAAALLTEAVQELDSADVISRKETLQVPFFMTTLPGCLVQAILHISLLPVIARRCSVLRLACRSWTRQRPSAWTMR